MSRWRYLLCLLMATYYVSDSLGSDANSGLLQAAPAKTLSWVSSHAKSPDDAFKLMRTDQFVGTLNCTDSGTAGHPITFGAWGSGAKPIIAPTDARGFYGLNVEYVYVDDIRVEGVGVVAATGKMADNSTDWNWGIDFESTLSAGTLSDIKVRRCEIVGCFGGVLVHCEAASTPAGWNGIEISDCLGHDLISLGGWLHGSVAYSSTGNPYRLPKGRTQHSNVLINNFVIYDVYAMPTSEYGTPGDDTTYTYHNFTGTGIVVQNTTTGVVANSLVYRTGHLNNDGRGGPVGIMTIEAASIVILTTEVYDIRTSGADGTGIDLDGGSLNCAVSRCYIHGCAGSPLACGSFAGGNVCDGNTFSFNITEGNGGTSIPHTFGTASNTTIERNTFDHVPSGDYAVLNGYGAGWFYINNIVITTGATKVLAHCTNTGGGIDLFQGNRYFSQSGHIRFTDDTHTNSGTPFSSIAGFRTSTNLTVPPETKGGVDCGSYGDPALLSIGGGGIIGNTSSMNALLTAYDPASGGVVNTAGVTGGTSGNDFHGNPPISGTAVGAVEYHSAGYPVFYVQRAAH